MVKLTAFFVALCVLHTNADYCTNCKERCSPTEEDCVDTTGESEKLLKAFKETSAYQEELVSNLELRLTEKYGDTKQTRDQIKIIECGFGARYLGSLPNTAFSASSWYNNIRQRRPRNARINLPNSWKNDGGWLEALPYEDGDWLQVDLGSVQHVLGVATQGQPNANAWVTSYKIKYSASLDLDEPWQTIAEDGQEKIFNGNVDNWSLAIRYFPQPVSARYIRFYVQTNFSWPALRVEIMKC